MGFTHNPAGMKPLQEVAIEADAGDAVFTFEMALPLTVGLEEHLQDKFLFDIHGVKLHGREEVRFSGVDRFTVMRPYVWGEVIRQQSAIPK
jgi:hypothetical protein